MSFFRNLETCFQGQDLIRFIKVFSFQIFSSGNSPGVVPLSNPLPPPINPLSLSYFLFSGNGLQSIPEKSETADCIFRVYVDFTYYEYQFSRWQELSSRPFHRDGGRSRLYISKEGQITKNVDCR